MEYRDRSTQPVREREMLYRLIMRLVLVALQLESA